MMDWQPIESAPKNTPVLVWQRGARDVAEGGLRWEADLPVVALLEDTNAWYREHASERNWGEKWVWRSDLVEFESGYESTGSYTVAIELSPTHWQPLPAPLAPA